MTSRDKLGAWAVLGAIQVLGVCACGSGSNSAGGDDASADGRTAGEYDAAAGQDGASAADGARDASVPDAPIEDGGAEAGPQNDAGDSGSAQSACGDASLGPSGTAAWATGFDQNGTTNGFFTAADPSGNVYIAGEASGAFTLLGDAGSVTASGNDAIVAKFTAGGTLLWADDFGNAGYAAAGAIAVDSSGNAYVGGYYDGTLDLGGPDAGGLALPSAGGKENGFLTKLDPSGHALWAIGFGNGTGYEWVSSIAVGAQGDIAVAIGLQGSVPIALTDGGTTTFTSAGGNDILLARFTSDGTFMGGKSWGDPGDQDVDTVALDSQGNLVIGGYFDSTLNFGSGDAGPGDFVAPANAIQSFVAKLDPTGHFLWGYAYGSGTNQGGGLAAVGPNDDVYVGATVEGNVSFGSGDAGMLSGPGPYNIVVGRYDSLGNLKWGALYGAASEKQNVDSIAVSPSGDLVMGGSYQGTLSIGKPLNAAGTQNAYVARLAGADGTPLWSRSYGGAAGREYLSSVALGGCTGIAISGGYNGTFGIPTTTGGNQILTAGTNMANDQTFVALVAQ